MRFTIPAAGLGAPNLVPWLAPAGRPHPGAVVHPLCGRRTVPPEGAAPGGGVVWTRDGKSRVYRET